MIPLRQSVADRTKTAGGAGVKASPYDGSQDVRRFNRRHRFAHLGKGPFSPVASPDKGFQPVDPTGAISSPGPTTKGAFVPALDPQTEGDFALPLDTHRAGLSRPCTTTRRLAPWTRMGRVPPPFPLANPRRIGCAPPALLRGREPLPCPQDMGLISSMGVTP